MNKEMMALLLCSIAGMATVLGGLIIFFSKGKNEKLLSASLGLAAGVMLSVSFLDLFPSGLDNIKKEVGLFNGILLATLALALGIIVSALLDHFVPHENDQNNNREHKDLYRLGILSMLAIGLHNFPEGIATFASTLEDLSLGLSIMVAITLHNIPEGISIAIPIYYATNSYRKAIFYTFLSGIAEPIGALLTYLFLGSFISPFILGFILCFVAGLMLYISLEELIPESRQYGYSQIALLFLFIGILLMPLSHLLA